MSAGACFNEKFTVTVMITGTGYPLTTVGGRAGPLDTVY